MKITKVINNNVVSAFNDEDQEVVVMGKGIGFKAQPGDLIDEERTEKVFKIENQTLANQFKELLSDIPLEHMQLTNDIITYAKANLEQKLGQSIYVTLTDHINFSIERNKQGIELSNALLWDIKRFYQAEYDVGLFAIKLIEERLGLQFSEDEAGFIALHFVNAEFGSNLHDTFAMTTLLQGILKIVKDEFQIEFDEQSLHYERFVTHIKFLAQRVYHHEMLKDDEIEFARLMQGKYPEDYECSKKIAAYIKAEYDEEISGEEIMYLAIHIKRVRMTERVKE